MTRTRSANWVLSAARGSRLKGAPALAASRCHARASAMLSLTMSSNACALLAQSAANDSWLLRRLASSIFSRTSLAAPLSLMLNSLKTSASCSALGLLNNQSRTRAERSPEVGAVNAPPVRLSRLAISLFLAVEVDVTVGSGNRLVKICNPVFSPLNGCWLRVFVLTLYCRQ